MPLYESPGMKTMKAMQRNPPDYKVQVLSTAGRSPPKHLAPLPTKPGKYWWTAWNAFVEVFQIGKSKKLYVNPPTVDSITVPITDYIAGDFYAHKKDAPK